MFRLPDAMLRHLLVMAVAVPGGAWLIAEYNNLPVPLALLIIIQKVAVFFSALAVLLFLVGGGIDLLGRPYMNWVFKRMDAKLAAERATIAAEKDPAGQ